MPPHSRESEVQRKASIAGFFLKPSHIPPKPSQKLMAPCMPIPSQLTSRLSINSLYTQVGDGRYTMDCTNTVVLAGQSRTKQFLWFKARWDPSSAWELSSLARPGRVLNNDEFLLGVLTIKGMFLSDVGFGFEVLPRLQLRLQNLWVSLPRSPHMIVPLW